MRLNITYSYSDELNSHLKKKQELDIKYIEIYVIDHIKNRIHSVYSSKESVIEYLANNKPNDDFRLHKFITQDAMFNDILPELDDPLSSHNLLLTNQKLSVKNILYFYFTVDKKILIVSFAVKQNNLFVAQKYIQYIELAKDIKNQYTNITQLTGKQVAHYALNGTKIEYLSNQQKIILKYIVSGLMNKEISKVTNLSTRTVEKHVSNICKRLSVSNRNQLIARYYFYAKSTDNVYHQYKGEVIK